MSSNASSSYQLILDHILTYPGNYEIPLRKMYDLNCGRRGSNTPDTPTSSTASSPHILQSSFSSDAPSTASLTESLMCQLSQLPNRSQSMPASFITAFVQGLFPLDLPLVDFPQALTGLDYLKDLEMRRRRDVASAMNRLGLDRESVEQDATVSALSDTDPDLADWVKTIEEKERKVDALYTQLYVGLRRWILVNELSLLPFQKHNCVAMLNTLYPPAGISVQAQPTSLLTPKVLKTQRDGFFKYIQAVEKGGPRVLKNLIEQGRAPTDENGWAAVVRSLGMYLQLANSIINDCNATYSIEDVVPHHETSSRRSRKADSGISFGSMTGSDRRPSTRNSDQEPMSPTEVVRPKTPSAPSAARTPSTVRSGTALEKLARGLRTIGRNKTDATEMIHQDDDVVSTPATDKRPLLRKMRSLGALSERKGSLPAITTRQNSITPAFDVEAMRQARAEYEARQHSDKRASNEV
jgi:hypothetical protein